MALLQISEPGASPDPHTRRHAVGIDLGTTHSLVAAVRNGVAECLPDREGRVILPSAVRYLPGGRAVVGSEALAGAVSDPTNTIVSVKRLMGRGLADIALRRPPRLRLRRGEPGHGPAAHGGRRQVAGRGLGRDPGDLAPARRGHVRRRALRRRHHRARLFRRRPAPGDQGRRRARRPARAAPDQRADRGGDRLRPRQRERGLVRGLRPRRRHLRHLAPAHDARRVRGRRHRRRLGARRRRHRCRARRLGARASGRHRRDRRRSSRRRDGRARGQGGAVRRRPQAEFACSVAGRKLSRAVDRAELEAIARPFVDRTLAAVRQRRARRQGRQGDDRRRRPGRRLDPHAARAPRGARALRPRAARPTSIRTRSSRSARRARPMRSPATHGAGDLLLLDVIPLSLGTRDDGRPGRAHHRAQQPDPDRAGAGASRPSRTARRRWRSTSSRASASSSPTAARWPASSCAASRRWSPARRASGSRSRSTPTAC